MLQPTATTATPRNDAQRKQPDSIRKLTARTNLIRGQKPTNLVSATLFLLVQVGRLCGVLLHSRKLPANPPAGSLYLFGYQEQIATQAEATLMIEGGWKGAEGSHDPAQILADIMIGLDAIAELLGISLMDAMINNPPHN